MSKAKSIKLSGRAKEISEAIAKKEYEICSGVKYDGCGYGELFIAGVYDRKIAELLGISNAYILVEPSDSAKKEETIRDNKATISIKIFRDKNTPYDPEYYIQRKQKLQDYIVNKLDNALLYNVSLNINQDVLIRYYAEHGRLDDSDIHVNRCRQYIVPAVNDEDEDYLYTIHTSIENFELHEINEASPIIYSFDIIFTTTQIEGFND